MGKKSQNSSKKSQNNVQSSWVDTAYSSTIFVFSKEGNINGVFLGVGTSSYLGFLTPSQNDYISSEYGDCVIPFYECTFSVLGLLLPFNAFEMEVLLPFGSGSIVNLSSKLGVC